MQTLDNEIVEKILSKKIEKQEAMRIFDGLSETDKLELISKIKYKMMDTTGEATNSFSPSKRLKPLDQRDLQDKHRDFIEKLTEAYDKFVPKSKANIPKNHFHFVDQRRNFHLIKELKKMHFQVTYEKADGAYIHDIDGNKYIDISGDMVSEPVESHIKNSSTNQEIWERPGTIVFWRTSNRFFANVGTCVHPNFWDFDF